MGKSLRLRRGQFSVLGGNPGASLPTVVLLPLGAAVSVSVRGRLD